MTKTPEEMAINYIKDVEIARNSSIATTAFPQLQRCFLAGYKAAMDEYKIAIDTYNDVAKQMMEEAVRIMSPQDQLADVSKVMNSPEKPDGWISVKERLPEKGLHVLTYGIYTRNLIVAWRDDCDEFLGMYEWVNEHESLDQVTHWMPLPEPPKEEK